MIRLSDHITAAGGWLSIEKFMELALYDPEEGYYSRSIQNIGPRGDFSTTSTMSPLLAKAIVAEWKKACKSAGEDLPMIEIGAGNATLSLSIMEALGFWGRLKINYNIVERSIPLTQLQHMALGNKANIYPDMEQALEHCHGKAFIFSNELVDAFPARVFEHTETGWMEVGLSVENRQIVESCRPIEELPLISTALECETQIGQRVEVHQSYHDWFRAWLPLWKKGIMTTIDYGDELQHLYYRKPKGTMRAYRSHQMITGMDIYESPGKHDLTCDVNFSDLLKLTEPCIGDKISLVSQRKYLAHYATDSREDAFLTDDLGAGSYFKVLIQDRLA